MLTPLSLCQLAIPSVDKVITNPVLTSYTMLKKTRPLTVHTAYFPTRIYTCSYSLPILLPELGCMVALDLVSESLRREIEEKRFEYTSFRSENQIMISKLYNFDASVNRVVSWGQYSFHEVDEDIYHLYIVNLINDLLLFPSVLTTFGPYSPIRWFWISSTDYHKFNAVISYNVNIIYLKKEFFTKAKKTTIWLGEPVGIYRIPCGYIGFEGTGYVKIKNLPIFTTHEPNRLLKEIEHDGGYYLCFSVGLCGYKTNYPNSLSTKFFINIIDSLLPLVHSPYDIAPFLFPYFVNKENLKDPVYWTEIPETVINSILRRFEKFGGHQSLDMVENYNRIFERTNKLVRIKKVNDKFTVMVVNPSVVPFLIRKCLIGSKYLPRKYARTVLKSQELLISQLITEYDFIMNIAMRGFKGISEFRKKNFEGYISLYHGT